MSRFKSAWEFIRFSETVRTQYRYSYPPEVTEFLANLVSTSESRTRPIKKEFTLWRAQLGHEITEKYIEDEDIVIEDAVPYSAERMKPKNNAAHEGRANPKGIPYLYVATDENTAMSEVRPWIGATISLGYFKTTRELNLVDFSVGHDIKSNLNLLLGNPSPNEIQDGIWHQVGKEFSYPISNDDSIAEYIPTQIIAETFRRAEFDGVVYKSMLDKGFNLALFDLESAELHNCSLFKAEKINYEFKSEGTTYFVKEKS